jgi:hypothetical protein
LSLSIIWLGGVDLEADRVAQAGRDGLDRLAAEVNPYQPAGIVADGVQETFGALLHEGKLMRRPAGFGDRTGFLP